MNVKDVALSLCYAKAFLNKNPEPLSDKDFAAICEGYSFFTKHKQISFLMRLSALDKKIKYEAIEKIQKTVGLSKKFEPLMSLVIDHKRAHLFSQIFNQLCLEYRKRNDIRFFSVSSSQELSDDQRQEVHSSLTHLLGGSIFCSYKVNSFLIAGIRLQSNEFLWESSIRQRLWRVQHSLMQR